MDRRSSLHEDFVRVKTPMGLERFEVENLLSLKKIEASLLAQEGIQIEKCFGTTEGLFISLNCADGIIASQNSYGFRAICS